MKRIFFIIGIFLLCSCTPRTVYVPVENKAVSLSADSLQRLIMAMAVNSIQTEKLQTVFVKETATYTLNEQGDTTKTIIERETDSSREWHTKEAYYLAVIDSLKQSRVQVDSVYVEKPVPVEVVREINVLKWWQKALMWIGGISGLWVVFILIRLIKGR